MFYILVAINESINQFSIEFEVNMIIICVFATRQILHSSCCPKYAFLRLYFDSMLILCNIFVKLEHFILFNKFDKYHNFFYYRINIKLMVHRQFMSRCSHAASTPLYL